MLRVSRSHGDAYEQSEHLQSNENKREGNVEKAKLM